MAPPSLVPFVQIDLPGAGGLPDGRYIVRGSDEPETVLVSELIGALPARGRLRGRKPAPQDQDSDPPALPLRRVTHALPERFDDQAAAKAWLAKAAGEGAEELAAGALTMINRAIGAFRVSAGDPAIHEAADDDALAIRVGYGTGDQIAASLWTEAVKLPPVRRAKRRPGTDDIRPQQRMAAILSGRDVADPWELHALRAQLDHAAGRQAEAVTELRAALSGFDTSPPDFAANLREEISARLAAARLALESSELDEEALADAVDLFARLQDRRRRPPVD